MAAKALQVELSEVVLIELLKPIGGQGGELILGDFLIPILIGLSENLGRDHRPRAICSRTGTAAATAEARARAGVGISSLIGAAAAARSGIAALHLGRLKALPGDFAGVLIHSHEAGLCIGPQN